MAVVKESEPFDWIQWLPGMWEVLPFCNPLSLLIFQPNVHIQQFCLAGNLNIAVSQRLLSWQQRLESGVVSPVFVFFFALGSHGRPHEGYAYVPDAAQCTALFIVMGFLFLFSPWLELGMHHLHKAPCIWRYIVFKPCMLKINFHLSSRCERHVS